MTVAWKVYVGSRFIGIIETNYKFAVKYWKSRGSQFELRPYNEKHLRFPNYNS